MTKHNHLAVWVMVVVNQLIGFVWYTYLLKDLWMSGQPWRNWNTMDKTNPMPFVFDIVGTILMCYFLSWLVRRLNVNTVANGIMTGLIIGFGLLIKAMVSHYAFLGMWKRVIAVDFGFTLFVVVLTTAVLAVWRKDKVLS